MANRRHGINGRIAVQFVLVLLEGIFLVLFSKTTTYNSAVILMVTFSICVQAANGSCFALVPYINCGMGKSFHSSVNQSMGSSVSWVVSLFYLSLS